MSDLLIVNASPLVFLGNAGRLDLLRELGDGHILVPGGVLREVTASAHSDRASSAVRSSPWIEAIEGLVVPASVTAWDLGDGESEVITAGLARRSARLVIDDLAGRKCALTHRLDVIGTLGVVIGAHRRGLVDDPAAVFAELRDAGMWMSPALIQRVLKLAGLSS